MVASHADEVQGGDAVVRSRCQDMVEAVHTELGKYREEQERELAELLSTQYRNEAAEERAEHLQQVLSKPLRLSPAAVAVSAKTNEGFQELQRMILDAAFDKEAFPTFGNKQPGTYGAIHRKLLRSHTEELSVTWEAMQESAAGQSELESSQLVVRCDASKLSSESADVGEQGAELEPEPEPDADTEDSGQLRIVGTVQCKADGWFPKFEATRAELSRAGLLTVEGRAPIDLTKPGTCTVNEPLWSTFDLWSPNFSCLIILFAVLVGVIAHMDWLTIKLVSGLNLIGIYCMAPRICRAFDTFTGDRPFCVRIECVDPARRFVLDMGNAYQRHRWLTELRAVAGPNTAHYLDYTFSICAAEEELKCFTIDYKSAKAVHKKLQDAGVTGGLTFPGSIIDHAKDFTRTEENWRQRGEEMERYFVQLFHKHDAISSPEFKANFDFDFAELAGKHNRVATKVRKDPGLLKRAITFLGMTGEVLIPHYENAPALAERVFLRPQWLVDIMKELVHHDLNMSVEEITPEETNNPVLMKELGQRFCTKGVLDRRLLTWLWRNLSFPLAQSEDEKSFVLELLTQLGLLTLLPQQDEPLWLLPLRLPPKDLHATASVAMAHAKFSAFLKRMGAADLLHGMENVAVLGLKAALANITGGAAVPQDAVDLAYRFADELLAAGPDENGLTRDEIAAIHLYTQDAIYQPLNRALWSQEREAVKPYWAFIRLLTQALFKIPKTSAGAVYRAISNPYEPITEHDMLAKATESCPAFPNGGSGEPVSIFNCVSVCPTATVFNCHVQHFQLYLRVSNCHVLCR